MEDHPQHQRGRTFSSESSSAHSSPTRPPLDALRTALAEQSLLTQFSLRHPPSLPQPSRVLQDVIEDREDKSLCSSGHGTSSNHSHSDDEHDRVSHPPVRFTVRSQQRAKTTLHPHPAVLPRAKTTLLHPPTTSGAAALSPPWPAGVGVEDQQKPQLSPIGPGNPRALLTAVTQRFQKTTKKHKPPRGDAQGGSSEPRHHHWSHAGRRGVSPEMDGRRLKMRNKVVFEVSNGATQRLQWNSTDLLNVVLVNCTRNLKDNRNNRRSSGGSKSSRSHLSSSASSASSSSTDSPRAPQHHSRAETSPAAVPGHRRRKVPSGWTHNKQQGCVMPLLSPEMNIRPQVDLVVGVLTYRDLRQLFVPDSFQQVGSIEVRRGCIVVCLPPVTGIIMHDRVYLIANDEVQNLDSLIAALVTLTMRFENKAGSMQSIDYRSSSSSSSNSLTDDDNSSHNSGDAAAEAKQRSKVVDSCGDNVQGRRGGTAQQAMTTVIVHGPDNNAAMDTKWTLNGGAGGGGGGDVKVSPTVLRGQPMVTAGVASVGSATQKRNQIGNLGQQRPGLSSVTGKQTGAAGASDVVNSGNGGEEANGGRGESVREKLNLRTSQLVHKVAKGLKPVGAQNGDNGQKSNLRTSVRNAEPPVAAKAHRAGSSAGGSGRGGGGSTKSTRKMRKKSVKFHYFPFEFRALELMILAAFEDMRTAIEGMESQLRCFEEPSYYSSALTLDLEKLHNLKAPLECRRTRIKQFDKAIDDLLKDSEDMKRMELTRYYQEPKLYDVQRMHEAPNPDLQILLEYFDQEADHYGGRLKVLAQTVENAERLISLRLSVTRNRLIQLDLAATLVAVGIAIGTSVSGLFGMNLPSQLETSHAAFVAVAVCVGSVTFITLVLVMIILSKSKL